MNWPWTTRPLLFRGLLLSPGGSKFCLSFTAKQTNWAFFLQYFLQRRSHYKHIKVPEEEKLFLKISVKIQRTNPRGHPVGSHLPVFPADVACTWDDPPNPHAQATSAACRTYNLRFGMF